MATTTQEMPRTIRARMHPDTLSHVPHMFNTSTQDVLRKLFQNARRSRPSHIDPTGVQNRPTRHFLVSTGTKISLN